MKNHLKTFWPAALLLFFSSAAPAQNNEKAGLELGTVPPYAMQVTYDKTSHLIFPSAIRYVDLGSDCLIASKAQDAENVLRIKASVKDFEQETNFSVITDEGRFYSFNVQYSSVPAALSYDLQTMQNSADKAISRGVLFEELGKTPPSLASLILETIYKNNKRRVKHIGSESFGVQFSLKGIYIHNGLYYFHTQLANQTNVPFSIDFMTFKVVDKKTARRTASQQITLVPLRIYKTLDEISGNAADQNVFLLDQFTIADDKQLLIEIFEKNGGRHQTLELENSDLVKAGLISDMHLKF
ncbi:conjugative transposon protein TraN [Flavobacterium tructae]|uniref:Conjugative transposon protein TraN n=1 Tax=Flavobacterium tructae TaxID=1114873 RepID=A0A1S1IZD1_9FLAO|nr:conjugative transposon protein TraN [Flavobacterium tructae]OHT43722.1 conjugative transposon protein TraN [Flavobacterium tructae]OXB15918.1 conjugative transposon protein TraN [Flavobacterium tructae]